jgi:hypothetical protein
MKDNNTIIAAIPEDFFIRFFPTSFRSKRAEGGLHILLAGDPAAVRVVQRLQFLGRGAVYAGAARFNVVRQFGKFFPMLLRPGGHVLQEFFDR